VLIIKWFVALNLVDMVLTLIILHNGGVELEPVAKWFINQGTGWFIFYQLVFIAFASFLLSKITPSCTRICNYVLTIIDGFLVVSLIVGGIYG
jgi:hypothetical protein